MLCLDLTNFQEVINYGLLKEKTDNVYYQHMTEATQHSYTPIEGVKQDDSKTILIIRHHSVKNEAVLVHARPSRESKIAGTGSLSL